LPSTYILKATCTYPREEKRQKEKHKSSQLWKYIHSTVKEKEL
jgi:hypothetical protein